LGHETEHHHPLGRGRPSGRVQQADSGKQMACPHQGGKQLPVLHADSKIRYNVTNDSTHLYLKMDVTDRLTIMKILQTGMRVFLGADGKKKERNELQFPIYVDKYELTEQDMNPAVYDIDRRGQLERDAAD
jgi:hypothetical protein